MKQYYIEQENEKLAFAQKAAKWFEDNPVDLTYRDSDFEKGSFLALRFGADFDCVVVVKLCEYEETINYCQIIDRDKSKAARKVHLRLIKELGAQP